MTEKKTDSKKQVAKITSSSKAQKKASVNDKTPKKNAKALGRGLDALLPTNHNLNDPGAKEKVLDISCDKIAANPLQPRRSFDKDKLAELAASIKAHGVMQPLLLVREESLPHDAEYMIVAGERRYRAACIAGLTTVPALVKELDPKEIAEISLIENIQREDLQPLEEAAAYRSLLEDYGYTQERLAENLGVSRPHISNTLRLLQLNSKEQQLLTQGQITAGHARALLTVRDPARRALVLNEIISQGMSVRQAEQLARVQSTITTGPGYKESPALSAPLKEPILQDISRRLSNRFGTKAQVLGKLRHGKLVLEYHSEDDLQRLIELLLPEEQF